MAAILTAFFLQVASTPPVSITEDAGLKVFIAVSGVLITATILGCVKLRDLVIAQERELKLVCENLKELKVSYEKDKVERHSLMTMATSIDTKIDAKLKEVLVELADQRREDAERMRQIITEQNQLFSSSISNLNNTLGQINVKLGYFTRDIDDLKGKMK